MAARACELRASRCLFPCKRPGRSRLLESSELAVLLGVRPARSRQPIDGRSARSARSTPSRGVERRNRVARQAKRKDGDSPCWWVGRPVDGSTGMSKARGATCKECRLERRIWERCYVEQPRRWRQAWAHAWLQLAGSPMRVQLNVSARLPCSAGRCMEMRVSVTACITEHSRRSRT